MSKSYPRRYIVFNERPLGLYAYEDGPQGGVLLWGDKATVFKSRKAAEKAIERSREYAEENGYDWDLLRASYRTEIVQLDLPEGL